MKAVIVGAGINGLSTAWALVRRGWQVEIADAGPVPNPKAASFDRHRLIRAHYPGLPGYAARVPAAFAAWAEMWRDLGQSHYVERGILALSRTEGDWTDRAQAGLAAAGIATETLSPETLARRYPMLDAGGVRFGLHTAQGGVLLADRILGDLAAWLVRRGARLHPGTRIDAVDFATGRVAGPTGAFQGDVAILAAGVGLPRLVPSLGTGFAARRSVVVYAAPPARWTAAWSTAPAWIDLGGEDDLWGMPPVAGIAMKLGFGRHTRDGDPERERRPTAEDAAATLAAYRGRIRDLDAYRVVETVANFYLMAPEERFVLRREGRVLILSADSGHGFKFGALTGLDLAGALDGGSEAATARRLAGHAA